MDNTSSGGLPSHPSLSPEINAKIAQTLVEGGADLRKLRPGRELVVTTANTTYRIQKTEEGSPRRATRYLMTGHPRICPEPTPATIAGSSWGGALLRTAFIGRGMTMEFTANGRDFMSTPIREIDEVDAGAADEAGGIRQAEPPDRPEHTV